MRGRRECRMRAAPAVSCAVCTKVVHMSIQGSGEHPTFPAQWLYGLWRDLPGRAVLVVTVAPRKLSPRWNLTPAYRAVRTTRFYRTPLPDSSIPASASTASPSLVRGDRERPSEWDEMG